ncbi:MAG: VCBS repeat-containing protein [Planctomycetes bacterium]|nr:VCBS repeat-containing protein [Planctomycetota bacterium]
MAIAGSSTQQVMVALGGIERGLAADSYLSIAGQAESVAAADMTGDGRDDVVTISIAQKTATVFRSRSDGSLVDELILPLPLEAGGSPSPRSICLSDLDLDGDIDLLVGANESGLLILDGDGHGGLSHRQTILPAESGAGVAVGSLNEDPYPDVVFCDRRGDFVYSLLGEAGGGLGSPVAHAVSFGATYGSVCLEDLDGDGHTDAIVDVGGSRPVTLLYGEGDGTFAAAGQIPPVLGGLSSAGRGVAALEVSGDGIPDVAELDFAAGKIHVWRGLGGRSFDDPVSISLGYQPDGLTTADFDGDGDRDLACTVEDTELGGIERPAIIVLWNTAQPDFPSRDTHILSRDARCLTAGDLDASSRLDVVASYGGLATYFSPASGEGAGEILKVIPAAGPLAGGTGVEIRGRGFSPGEPVRFGGAPASTVEFRSTEQLIAVTPPRASAGYVDVQVGSATLRSGFLYRDGRRLTSAEPAWAPMDGGTTVTLRGEGFVSAGMTVWLGAFAAPVVSVSPEEVVITTPAVDFTGAVDIVLADAAGKLRLGDGFFFGDRTVAPVASVSIMPVDGGRRIQWANGEAYDSVRIVRSDGVVFDLSGDETEFYDLTAGAGDVLSYQVIPQIGGLVGELADEIVNPVEIPQIDWLYAEGHTRQRDRSFAIPLEPDIVYGTKINLPSDREGVPVNRFLFSCLVERRHLWGKLKGLVYASTLDQTDGDRFIRYHAFDVPVRALPGEPGWVTCTVEIESPEWVTDDPWHIPFGELFFCLTCELREGEEAFVDEEAPIRLLVDDGGHVPSFNVYAARESCALTLNLLPHTPCHDDEGRIRPVAGADPMIRIKPLTQADPRVKINRIEYRENYADTSLMTRPLPLLRAYDPQQLSLPGGRMFEFRAQLDADFTPYLDPIRGGRPGIAEYRWSFGDGIEEVTSLPVVTHTYEQSGLYLLSVNCISIHEELGALPLPYQLTMDVSRPGSEISGTQAGDFTVQGGGSSVSLVIGTPVFVQWPYATEPELYAPFLYNLISPPMNECVLPGDGPGSGAVEWKIDFDGSGGPAAPFSIPALRVEERCNLCGQCYWGAPLDATGWHWPPEYAFESNELHGEITAVVSVENSVGVEETVELGRFDADFQRAPISMRDDWDERQEITKSRESWFEDRNILFDLKFPDFLEWNASFSLGPLPVENSAYAGAHVSMRRNRRTSNGSTSPFEWVLFSKVGSALTLLNYKVFSREWTTYNAVPDSSLSSACQELAESLNKPGLACMELAETTLFEESLELLPLIEIRIATITVVTLKVWATIWGDVKLRGKADLAVDPREDDEQFGSVDGIVLTVSPEATLSVAFGGAVDLVIATVKLGAGGAGTVCLPVSLFAGLPFGGTEAGDLQSFFPDMSVDFCWAIRIFGRGSVCLGSWPLEKCWTLDVNIPLLEYDSCPVACGAKGTKDDELPEDEIPADGLMFGPMAAAGAMRDLQVLIYDVDPTHEGVRTELYFAEKTTGGAWGTEMPFYASGNGRAKLNPAVAWIPGGGDEGRFLAAWTEIALSPEELESLQVSHGEMETPEGAARVESILSSMEIYAAVYTPTTGMWSSPVRITDDAIGDGEATVCADLEAGKARLGWVRITHPEGALLQGDSVIRTCTFDLGSLSVEGSPVDLGAGNDRIDKDPFLTSVSGRIALVWVQDEDRDIGTNFDHYVQVAMNDAVGTLVQGPGLSRHVPGASQPTAALSADGNVLVYCDHAQPVFTDDIVHESNWPLLWQQLYAGCPDDPRPPCNHLDQLDWAAVAYDQGRLLNWGRLRIDEVIGWVEEVEELTQIGRVEGGVVDLRALHPEVLQVGEDRFDVAFSFAGLGVSSDLDREVGLVSVDLASGMAAGPALIVTADTLADHEFAGFIDSAGNIEILLTHDIAGREPLLKGGKEKSGESRVLRPFLGPDLAVELRTPTALPAPGQILELEIELRSVGYVPLADGDYAVRIERSLGDGFWELLGEVLISTSFADDAAPSAALFSYRPPLGEQRIRAVAALLPDERTGENNAAEVTVGIRGPQDVFCSQSVGPDVSTVEVTWNALTASGEARISRDGRVLAVVPAQQGSWLDERAPLGEHTWSVVFEMAGCLSPAVRCAVEVYEQRLLLRVADSTLLAGGPEGEVLVHAHLAPDVAMRGFAMGLSLEEPLELVAVDVAGTASEAAEHVSIEAVDGGVVVDVRFGDAPASWIEGDDLPVLRIVVSAAGVDPTGLGPAGLAAGISIRDDLGSPPVPVALLPPSGVWELAGRQAGVVSVIGAAGPRFRRGDVDGNSRVEITDAISLLAYLFLGGATPGCPDAADADDNGSLEITDPIRILGYLFLGSLAPPPPGPDVCGEDPTVDALGPCEYRCD